MKVRFVVFSGYNDRAIIAFFRTLKKNNVGFDIIACTKEDFVFRTIYAQNVVYVRKGKELSLPEITTVLKQIKVINNTDEKYVILPSSEFLNRFLLRNRKEIEELGFEIPLVEEALYDQISDKSIFATICNENGIKIPEVGKEIPMVAKPKYYFSTDARPIAPYLLLTESEYQEFKEKEKEEDFFFQRYIEGESLYLLCYFYKDGTVDVFSQRNLIQQTGGKSIVAAEYSDFWKTEEADKYVNLLKSMSFRGLIMIEVRKEKHYYMIEANPRIWGPSQFLLDSQANLLESMLNDLGAIESRPQILQNYRKDAKYFWKKGLEKETVLHCEKREAEEKWEELKKYDIFSYDDILSGE